MEKWKECLHHSSHEPLALVEGNLRKMVHRNLFFSLFFYFFGFSDSHSNTAKPPSPGSTISSSGPHAAFLTNLKGNRPTTKTSLSTSLSIPSLLDKESGCPEKDGEEKKLRKGNKEREKKKGKGRSKRQKIEEEDHEKLLVERRIQNFKQQADFRNSLSNMDLLKRFVVLKKYFLEK